MNQHWRIGDVAKAFQISADTLRYYEKAGLLPVHKDANNGYRAYRYDDIIRLMDILFFRSLNLPIRDIRQTFDAKGLGEVKAMLSVNEATVRDQLQELRLMEQKLRVTIARYAACETRVGKFSIVSAPPLLYKIMAAGDADILQVIQRYQLLNSKWLRDLRYTIRISQKDILRRKAFLSASLGLSVTRSEADAIQPNAFLRELSPPPAGEYLYTIVATDYGEAEDAVLLSASAWLKERNKRVAGDLIGCFMAASHKPQKDYYEIWIPII